MNVSGTVLAFYLNGWRKKNNASAPTSEDEKHEYMETQKRSLKIRQTWKTFPEGYLEAEC